MATLDISMSADEEDISSVVGVVTEPVQAARTDVSAKPRNKAVFFIIKMG